MLRCDIPPRRRAREEEWSLSAEGAPNTAPRAIALRPWCTRADTGSCRTGATQRAGLLAARDGRAGDANARVGARGARGEVREGAACPPRRRSVDKPPAGEEEAVSAVAIADTEVNAAGFTGGAPRARRDASAGLPAISVDARLWSSACCAGEILRDAPQAEAAAAGAGQLRTRTLATSRDDAVGDRCRRDFCTRLPAFASIT
mmetsp:Transcript_51282/g.121530  ORF Transcript_51282/g.121530 Transcript_51282/m.121530 type:complete len:203 (-) Transcript_51282:72-680(-)